MNMKASIEFKNSCLGWGGAGHEDEHLDTRVFTHESVYLANLLNVLRSSGSLFVKWK